MATYNPKFELYFQDVKNRHFKAEILKKGYDGSVESLIGTTEPVVIEWDGDDNVYSPIRGSRCSLSLMVNEDTNYDEFHKADEREYLLRILKHDSAGYYWESEEGKWDLTPQLWSDLTGGDNYWEPIWTGYIVVDRFKEQLLSTPYEMKLEAIDGLGTLGSFNAPFDTSDTAATKNVFYYVKEILKLTGHEHNIYIANEIRKTDGSANDTIFHDIKVSPYAFFTENLIFRKAKEILEQILKITNSRIYHAKGSWYITSNSNLIEKDIDQLALCPSGADTVVDPTEFTDPTEEVVIPIAKILTNGLDVSTHSFRNNATVYFGIQNTSKASAHDSYVFTLNGSTVKSGGTESPTYSINNLDSSNNNDVVAVTLTNTAGSHADSVTLSHDSSSPPDPEPDEIGGDVIIQCNLIPENAILTPLRAVASYEDHEVGDTFAPTFILSPKPGYQLRGGSNYSLAGVGQTLTISDNGNGTYTITSSVTLPSGGGTFGFSIVGILEIEKFKTTVNFTNNVSNATLDSSSLIFNSPARPYPDSVFTGTVTLTAGTDKYFNSISDITATIGSTGLVSRSLRLKSDTEVEITVSGEVPEGTATGTERTETVTIAGLVYNDSDATAITSGVTIQSALTVGPFSTAVYNNQFISNPSNTSLLNGRFKVIAIVHTGGTARVDWVTIQLRNNLGGATTGGNEATRSISLYLSPNNTFSPRYALIKFVTLDESTTIHTLTLTQNGMSL
tara:strand:- start:749 stop:2941 length:2193 start_codon:yes stop_codon:yes gene_type:complete